MTALRIAVVTPYYKESTQILDECHKSVLHQTIPADHYMIADGFPNADVSGWGVHHVTLPQANSDNGNTPRGIGSQIARSAGYDYIAYLDADNWFAPNHLETLLTTLNEQRSDISCAFRTFHSWDGRDLNISEADEDALKHVDTSSIFLHRRAFDLISVWTQMPKQLSPMCDRVFYAAAMRGRYKIAFMKKRTVRFRAQYAFHYKSAGLPTPEGTKPADVIAPSYNYLKTATGVQDCIETLGFWPLRYMGRVYGTN